MKEEITFISEFLGFKIYKTIDFNKKIGFSIGKSKLLKKIFSVTEKDVYFITIENKEIFKDSEEELHIVIVNHWKSKGVSDFNQLEKTLKGIKPKIKRKKVVTDTEEVLRKKVAKELRKLFENNFFENSTLSNIKNDSVFGLVNFKSLEEILIMISEFEKKQHTGNSGVFQIVNKNSKLSLIDESVKVHQKTKYIFSKLSLSKLKAIDIYAKEIPDSEINSEEDQDNEPLKIHHDSNLMFVEVDKDENKINYKVDISSNISKFLFFNECMKLKKSRFSISDLKTNLNRKERIFFKEYYSLKLNSFFPYGYTEIYQNDSFKEYKEKIDKKIEIILKFVPKILKKDLEIPQKFYYSYDEINNLMEENKVLLKKFKLNLKKLLGNKFEFERNKDLTKKNYNSLYNEFIKNQAKVEKK